VISDLECKDSNPNVLLPGAVTKAIASAYPDFKATLMKHPKVRAWTL